MHIKPDIALQVKIKVKKTMQKIRIDSGEDLSKKLDLLPSLVGTRLKRRIPEIKENFVLKKYLSILLKNNRLQFPIEIEKDESPDFIISIGTSKFGIEITESTFESYQYLLTQAERLGCVYPLTVFEYGKEYSYADVVKYLVPLGTRVRDRALGNNQGELYASGWAKDSLLKKIHTIEKWDARKDLDIRVLLYQNCPAWIADIKQFVFQFRRRIEALSEADKTKTLRVSIDYLSTDGEMLGYDIAGEGATFGTENRE